MVITIIIIVTIVIVTITTITITNITIIIKQKVTKSSSGSQTTVWQQTPAQITFPTQCLTGENLLQM